MNLGFGMNGLATTMPSLYAQPAPPKRSWQSRLYDRMMPAQQDGLLPLDDKDKKALVRQGLLQMGIGLLQHNNMAQGLGAGLQGGLLAMNQGAENIADRQFKQKYYAAQGVPSEFRAVDMIARAAGYQPGTPEYQQFMRVKGGIEGRGSSAGFGFEKVIGADGRERMGRTNPRTGQFEVYDEGTGSFVPMGGAANINGSPMPSQGAPQVVFDDTQNMPAPVVAGLRSWTSNTPDIVGGAAPIPVEAYSDRIPNAQANPALGVSQSPAEKAYATEVGQQGAQLAVLPKRGQIDAQNAAIKAAAEAEAKAAAEARAAQQFGTAQSREAAAEARKKLPQLGAVRRGVDRIGQALRALNMPGINTGPLDQYVVRKLPVGQELETAVGAIQNSMLALVRVPGVGSQSDLEARVAAMQYPSLDKDPAVNARTYQDLTALYQDLQAAYDNVVGGAQGAAPSPASEVQAIAPEKRKLKFNPKTGKIE